MQLDPTAFNHFLAGIGQQVTWRAAFACVCRNPTSGAPDTKCQHCAGKGQIWDAAQPTVCGVSGQKTQAKWEKSGRWLDGDVVVTIPGDSAMWGIGQFDRVTLSNAAERFSQSLVRNSPGDRLLHNVLTIDRVFWLHPTTKAIVMGTIPEVGPTGVLTWASGGPAPGVQYSVTGTRLPEYYCFDNMVQSRNEHSGARLPKNAVLRRWDLWGR